MYETDTLDVINCTYDDGYYDFSIKFCSDMAQIKSKMYIREDTLMQLKTQIHQMYLLQLPKFSFQCKALLSTDAVNLDFILNNRNGHVIIKYDIVDEDSIFRSSIVTDLESLHRFGEKITLECVC